MTKPLATLHNSFQLFGSEDRQNFLKVIQLIEKVDFTEKENCWLASIDLMQMCLGNEALPLSKIESVISGIVESSEKAEINSIENLPIEAFYLASKKLQNLNEYQSSLIPARQALEWIGHKNNRRKAELKSIIQTTPDEKSLIQNS